MRPRSRAFMIFDVILALTVLGVLMIVMAVGLHAHQQTALRLGSTRDACNGAESALTDLQQGRPPEKHGPVDELRVDPLTGGTPVPGFTWVRVSASAGGHTESLTGLVRSAALKGR